jgi:hypothetical protein
MEHLIQVKVADRDDGSERWLLLFKPPTVVAACDLIETLILNDPLVPIRVTIQPKQEKQ